jgi:hypothetical protein
MRVGQHREASEATCLDFVFRNCFSFLVTSESHLQENLHSSSGSSFLGTGDLHPASRSVLWWTSTALNPLTAAPGLREGSRGTTVPCHSSACNMTELRLVAGSGQGEMPMEIPLLSVSSRSLAAPRPPLNCLCP